MKRLYASLCIASLLMLHPGVVRGQAGTEPFPAASGVALVPITVDIVIARYTGEKADKKVSSVPYTLAVSATPRAGQQGPPTSLRMGNRVPIPSTTFTAAGAGNANPLVSYNYQDVGMSIDARASVRQDGRFELFLSIDENSVAPPSETQGVQVGGPILRSLRLNNTVVVRDGETKQFTMAADRVTGETVKVDVTVKTVK